jgi:uncharacterized protein (DUF1501 family)
MSRRTLLRLSIGSLCALAAPALPWRARAAGQPDNRTLVVLFQRGGADGLNLVIPRGDGANYDALRQDIAIAPGGAALELDGFFEFHPGYAPLIPLYRSGQLAVVHAVGGGADYSHFTAQDSIERAAPASGPQLADGWLNNALAALQAQADLDADVLALSGISIGAATTKALAGPAQGVTLAVPSLAEFQLTGNRLPERTQSLTTLFTGAANAPLASAAFGALGGLGAVSGLASQPPGATYPAGDSALNRALQDAARLIKVPELGVKAITINYGGWDHHTDTLARMNTVAGRLGNALAAFHADLGSASSRTLVLVLTEFGRTAAKNGGGGTDHGWATQMLVLGGGIAGGRVLTRGDPSAPGTGLVTPSGHWPGLGPGELHVQPGSGQARDLKATTDFRDVFGEILESFLGIDALRVSSQVLRGYTPQSPGLFA